MDNLQKEFQTIIKNFQDKAVELARQESEEQINRLQKKVGTLQYWQDRQSKILNELKKVYEEFTFDLEEEKKGREASFQNETAEANTHIHEVAVCTSVSDEKVNLNELNKQELHSIKDRVKHIGYNPENFSNTDLAHIGRQMSAHYRKTYDGRDPGKKEEKINDKHNSLVCAYAKVDWPYMDKLIKTTLDPLISRVSDQKENLDEKHTATRSPGAETEVPVLHSVKDRIKHMNQDLQRFDNKDLCSIGKKMVTYYRKMNKGKDPVKRTEKINDKHNSLVCTYSENDWEYLDYLIVTTLKIQ
jgi:predicted RNase H-like nuclease